MNGTEQHLRAMGTPELIRHALDEAKLLVKAEVLHAKHELRQEVRAARTAGILFGAAGALAIAALAVLLVALALALPWAPAACAAGIGLLVAACAVACALAARAKMPRQPLPRTQERLKLDFNLTREQLA